MQNIRNSVDSIFLDLVSFVLIVMNGSTLTEQEHEASTVGRGEALKESDQWQLNCQGNLSFPVFFLLTAFPITTTFHICIAKFDIQRFIGCVMKLKTVVTVGLE